VNIPREQPILWSLKNERRKRGKKLEKGKGYGLLASRVSPSYGPTG